MRAARKVHEADFAGADGVKRRLHYYAVELDAEPAPGEHLFWLGPEDAGRMPFPDDRDLLRRFAK